MSERIEPAIADTLKNLINQFSQELCFYRELVQNSLDAGATVVDISLSSHREEGAARETVVIRVVDNGEGMNRQVIDTELTRLFNSSKENDLTKIGKFGIGFVSVFAVKPEAVIVDTGKDGEYWRILFHPDGRFDRLRLDEPIEGTDIKIVLQMKKGGFPDFVTRSLETLKAWCRHSPVPITFQEERLNEPFTIDSPLAVSFSQEGTTGVLALTDEKEPFFGFYHGGITLLEGHRLFFPGVAFKADSRYLEHTIARDNIRQDKNYAKLLAILETHVRKELPGGLFKRLQSLLAAHEYEKHDALVQAGSTLLYENADRPGLCETPIIPLVSGESISLKELAARRSRLINRYLELDFRGTGFAIEEENDSLASRFPLVVKCVPESALALFLRTLGKAPVVPLYKTFADIEPLEATPALTALKEHLLPMLQRLGSSLTRLQGARFSGYFESYPYLLADSVGDVIYAGDLTPAGQITEGPARIRKNLLKGGKSHLLLNREHSYIRSLLDVAGSNPQTAAFLLARVLYLEDGVNVDVENMLLQGVL